MKNFSKLLLVLVLLTLVLPCSAQFETVIQPVEIEAASKETGNQSVETEIASGETYLQIVETEVAHEDADVKAFGTDAGSEEPYPDPVEVDARPDARSEEAVPSYQPGLTEQNEYFFYAPEGLAPGRWHPLIVAFSPGANGRGLIKDWRDLADKYGCLLFASKIVKNGMNIPVYLKRIVKLINERIAPKFPVKTDCIIAVGTSGGGMSAHLFSFFHPGTVAGVISSVGYIHENSLKQFDAYPRNKACVFLTSPTDFNYKLMKEDIKFLEKHDWSTLWLEFEGGHRTGPLELRDEALGWILKQQEVAEKLN